MGLFDQNDEQAQLELQQAEKSLKWEKPKVVIICFIIAFMFGIFSASRLGSSNLIFVLGGAFGFAIASLILPGIVALIAKLLKFRWHYAFAISFAIIKLLSLTVGNLHS